MRNNIVLLSMTLAFVAMKHDTVAQINESEGLRMPGDWNGWNNTNGMGGDFDLTKIAVGTVRWHTIFQYTGLTGNQNFKFVSGTTDPWYNQWAQNTGVTLNSFNSFTFCTPCATNNTVSLTNGKWYTINFEDKGYVNTNAIFMETSAAPVTFSSLAFAPNTNIEPWETVTVTLTADAAPCTEEKIYLRYTTDDFTNSTLVEFNFTGTEGTAQIPNFASGTTVKFYAFSSTLNTADLGTNYDLGAIHYINNSGSNYSYTVITPTTYTTATSGNFSAGATWVGGGVPPSGSHLSVSHALTIDADYTSSGVTINNGGTLSFSGTETLTVESFGQWTNNGTFSAGNGILKFESDVSTGGTNTSTFNNITISGTNVNFDSDKSIIAGTLKITTGNISAAPQFAENSTLRYEQGGTYNRVTEWNNPWHVEVGNNTTLNLNIAAFGGDITTRGNLTIETGAAVDMEAATDELIVNGNLLLDGTLTLSTAIGGDLQIKGNWTRTGTFTPNDRLVTFNGTSAQTLTGHTTFDYLTIAGSATLGMNDGITINDAIVISSTGTLNMSNQLVDGAGSFTLNSGGILKIGHSSGIEPTGATGNIQVSGTRTFASDATYHYTGNGNQLSGSALPSASATKNLIVELANTNNELTINTANAIEIAAGGKLQIIGGTLIEADNPVDGRHVFGAGNFTMSGGTYALRRVASSVDVPRMTGTYSITGGTISLKAAGDQKLKTQNLYYHLSFAGSGTATVGTCTNLQSVTISDTKTVDVGSSQLGGAGTNITMTGGTLKISRLTGTQPAMEGTYNLSGGTVELYGTSESQTQTLRNNISYYNVNLKASATNLTAGNATIASGGNIDISGILTVNAPTCLHLSTTTNSYVSGSGKFVVQSNAALRIGNSIKTGTTEGNIRTTTKTLATDATYILHGNANQTIETPFPTNATTLTIDKSGGSVTFNQDITIAETLTLTAGILNMSGHTITIDNELATALTGGSSTSYIVGTLVRKIKAKAKDPKAETYLFPIGTVGSYNPATLTFSTLPDAAGIVEAHFETTLDPNYKSDLPITDGTQTIDHVSDQGYWVLTPTGLANYTYDITIAGGDFATADPVYEVTDATGLRLLVREDFSNPWKFVGTHATGGTAPPSVSRTGVNNEMGIIAMGAKLSDNNVLPIELMNLRAVSRGSTIDVVWETASETNNDFFELFHSSDGISYKSIAQLTGAGNSTQTKTYAFTHTHPNQGINYYYLKQTDFDGTTTNSHIVSTTVYETTDWNYYIIENTLHITPNSITVQKINYRVFNLNGQLLSSGKCVYEQGKTMNLQIPASTIIVQFITENGLQYSQKIININN